MKRFESRQRTAPIPETVELEKEIERVEEEKVWPLHQLLGWIQHLVQTGCPDPVWIEAEISRWKVHASGHAYLELIERSDQGKELAKVNARIWASHQKGLTKKFEKITGAPIKDGIKIQLKVLPDFSPQYGMGLTISDLKPLWEPGQHEVKKQAIRDQMLRLGILNQQHQKNLPDLITRIMVIAPSEAAGLGDFMAEAHQWSSLGLLDVKIVTSTFEGESSSLSIVKAFQNASLDYDCVLILRGGGSKASLAWMDDEAIVESMLRCPIPVWVAIGHEQDSGLLDELGAFVSHTPSKAAQKITEMLTQELYSFNESWQGISSEHQRRQSLLLQSIDFMMSTIEQEKNMRINNLKSRIDECSREAIGLGPQNTLSRGFAIVTDPESRCVIRDPKLLKTDDVLDVFWEGEGRRVQVLPEILPSIIPSTTTN